jgi:small subunit ribosomal protein S17
MSVETLVPQARASRKVREGVVTSDKMMKTIVVQVTDHIRHGKYNRVMPLRNSFKVHDEQNTAHLGDLVRIMETRPLSRDKRWRLVKILKKASTAPAVPDAPEAAILRRSAKKPNQTGAA